MKRYISIVFFIVLLLHETPGPGHGSARRPEAAARRPKAAELVAGVAWVAGVAGRGAETRLDQQQQQQQQLLNECRAM